MDGKPRSTLNLPAIVAQDHDVPLALARIYNNTIYTANQGIHFGSAAPEGDFVVGNLVCAGTAIDGAITTHHDNVTDTFANAATYVNAPSFTLGSMDFYPKAGKATGAALDLSSVATDTGYDRDFNGTAKAGFTYRGAYAGEGENPGWPLGDGLENAGVGGGATSSSTSGATTGAGTGGGSPSGSGTGGGTDGGGSSKSSGTGGDGGGKPGSGCAMARSDAEQAGPWGLLVGALAVAWARRRRVRRGR